MPPAASDTVDRRPLAERLRPRSLREIAGNRRALSALRSFAEAWDESAGPPRLRAALLEGPPGVGKTTAALALAAEHGWTVVEMNASDARNQSAIDEVAGRAALTNTLGSFGVYRGSREGGRTLILLDEADCLTGRLTEESSRERAPTSFREFLRGRYGEVESLAREWGLGRSGSPPAFDSWDDVPTTGGRGAWTRLPAAQRDIREWKESQRPVDYSDRGGLAAIARLVRDTRQPIMLTVNDSQPLTRYSPVFRTGVARVHFEALTPSELRTFLRHVVVQESLTVAGPVLDRIIERSQGDLRAALNDLEAVAPLPLDVDALPLLGVRDTPADFYEVTREVLDHPRYYRSVEVSNRLDAPPDDLLPWVEESLSRRLVPPAARESALVHLRAADLFLTRARRQRVYGLWSYATEAMTGGVGLALAGSAVGSAGPVGFPEFLGAMGRSKALRALRQAVLAKAGSHFHLSRRKGVEAVYPFLEELARSDKGHVHRRALLKSVVRELELTPEEVGFLLGREPEHPEVTRLLGSSAGAPAADLPADTDESPGPRTAKRRVQRRLAEF